HELRAVTADQLMYIKEDLIIPQHYTFYDFIVTKARGKSGPLFAFDVHDDVRLVSDATVERDESHAGKVLLRAWYERNKHIFPASRWEPYDPTKNYDKYTIGDRSMRARTVHLPLLVRTLYCLSRQSYVQGVGELTQVVTESRAQTYPATALTFILIVKGCIGAYG
ncbi:unnamed protein product, partial [Oppiella nova]